MSETEEAVGSTFGRAVAAAVSKALGPRLLPARDLAPGEDAAWKEILFVVHSDGTAADHVDGIASSIAGLAGDGGLRFRRPVPSRYWPEWPEAEVVDEMEVVLRVRWLRSPFGATCRVRFAVEDTGTHLPCESTVGPDEGDRDPMSYDDTPDPEGDGTWRALAWRTAGPSDLPKGLQGPHLGASLRNAVPYLQVSEVCALPRRLDDVAKLLQAAADDLAFLETRFEAALEREALSPADYAPGFEDDPSPRWYRITNRSGSELYDLQALSPEGAMVQFIAGADGREAASRRRKQWEAGEWTVALAPDPCEVAPGPDVGGAKSAEPAAPKRHFVTGLTITPPPVPNPGTLMDLQERCRRAGIVAGTILREPTEGRPGLWWDGERIRGYVPSTPAAGLSASAALIAVLAAFPDLRDRAVGLRACDADEAQWDRWDLEVKEAMERLRATMEAEAAL